MTDIDDLALDYYCGYCHRQPGEWCKTVSGGRASWLHSARIWPVQQAYSLGYEESEKYRSEDRAKRADALRDRMRTHGVDEQAIEEILAGVMDKRWFW